MKKVDEKKVESNGHAKKDDKKEDMKVKENGKKEETNGHKKKE